jgi:hypothetical protein
MLTEGNDGLVGGKDNSTGISVSRSSSHGGTPMKRGLVLLCALGLVFAVVITAEAKKDDKPQKVLIAHVEEVIEGFVNEAGEVGTLTLYHVISVSNRSLDAHAAHGDIVPAPPGYVKCDRFEEFVPYPPPE